MQDKHERYLDDQKKLSDELEKNPYARRLFTKLSTLERVNEAGLKEFLENNPDDVQVLENLIKSIDVNLSDPEEETLEQLEARKHFSQSFLGILQLYNEDSVPLCLDLFVNYLDYSGIEPDEIEHIFSSVIKNYFTRKNMNWEK